MHCSLGLDCAQMGLDECGECINEEACFRYAEPCDLYEIVLLEGLPGAVYLAWYGNKSASYYEWTRSGWGFKELNNCDWLLHYTAASNDFSQWQHAYYKLSNRRCNKYVRADLCDEFERLRRQVDPEYAKNQDALDFNIF